MARIKNMKNAKKVENPGVLLKRLMGYIMKHYGAAFVTVLICILISVICNVQGTMFMQTLIDDYIVPMLKDGSRDFSGLAHAITRVAGFYAIGVAVTLLYSQIMVNITQGTLRSLRDDLFTHMQDLPIKYFDTHAHGDIMSVYTNDIDTLRQMISQSIPQIFNSGIMVVSIIVCMLVLSVPLTVVSLAMVGIMVYLSKRIATLSGKYFVQQQKDLGAANGYISSRYLLIFLFLCINCLESNHSILNCSISNFFCAVSIIFIFQDLSRERLLFNSLGKLQTTAYLPNWNK